MSRFAGDLEWREVNSGVSQLAGEIQEQAP